MITRLKILSNLCYYDPRHPDYDNEEKPKRKQFCTCDNCFYNRTPLAEELLNSLELIRYSKLVLIQVKEGEIEIYPNDVNTPDYLQQVETAIKNINIEL